MPTKTVSDIIIDTLQAAGVKRVYGLVGDSLNGLTDAIRARKDMEFIQVRHEEMAAFMAAGHAKFTGELGVCLSTGGPGATHLLTGLYDAKMDHAPVLAIAGNLALTRFSWTTTLILLLHAIYCPAALALSASFS